MKRVIVFLFAFVLGTFVQADIVLEGQITTLDFTGYEGNGFVTSPNSTQLDSDNWRTTGMSDGATSFGGEYTTGDYARGPSEGGETTGGFYGFDVDNTAGTTNRALGVQPGANDWTPGEFVLRLQNNTGQTITKMSVSYSVIVYNDEGRSNSFNFSHSPNDSEWTSVSAHDFASPGTADGSPQWVSTRMSNDLTGLSIADGNRFYLRWRGTDLGGEGSRDEFALDDVRLDHIPEPATFALFGLCVGAFLYNRRKFKK